MEKQYLLLLIVAYVAFCVYGDMDRCPRFLNEECDLSLYPDDYPNTVEELKKDCRSLKTLINCVINARENCLEYEEQVKQLRNSLAYINRVCEEDSYEFSVISNNLDCITRTARTVPDSCHSMNLSDKTKEMLQEYAIAHAESSNILNEENMKCFEYYFEVACPSITIGLKCGDEVENVVSEMLGNTVYNLQFCDDDVLEELKPFKQIIKLALKSEQDIENEIKKKK